MRVIRGMLIPTHTHCFFVSLKLNLRKCKNKKAGYTEAHITEILIKISYKMSKIP